MKLRRFLNIMSFISLLSVAFLLFIIGYWLFYPYNPITFNFPKGQTHFRVLTPTVRAGGTLKYEVNYCKNMNTTAVVTATFNNGIIYSTPSTLSNKGVGCHIITIFTDVPTELPPTTYTRTMTYSYQVNPIRRIDITATTGSFIIIPNN
jgi:hypothetical protein